MTDTPNTTTARLVAHALVNNPFSENTYVVGCTATREALLIDPGMSTALECEALEALLLEHDYTVTGLVLTHAHVDHVLGLPYAVKRFGFVPRVHALEHDNYTNAPAHAQMFGVRCQNLPEADFTLAPGDVLTVGHCTLDVRFTPGHSAGSVSLVSVASGLVIAGDVLFANSIGRTDLPGGDFDVLAQSIRTELYSLPDATAVWSGHGGATTIGHEKRHNPYVKAL